MLADLPTGLVSESTVLADPDRRSDGKRLHDASAWQPDPIRWWQAATSQAARVALKLGPGYDLRELPYELSDNAGANGQIRIVVIGWAGECREILALWQRGDDAKNNQQPGQQPGQRPALIAELIDDDGEAVATLNDTDPEAD